MCLHLSYCSEQIPRRSPKQERAHQSKLISRILDFKSSTFTGCSRLFCRSLHALSHLSLSKVELFTQEVALSSQNEKKIYAKQKDTAVSKETSPDKGLLMDFSKLPCLLFTLRRSMEEPIVLDFLPLMYIELLLRPPKPFKRQKPYIR